MMAVTGKSILAVLVGVQACIDHGAAAAAGRGACKGIIEFSTFCSEIIEIGCLDSRCPVTTKLLTEIIGDHQQHILSARHDDSVDSSEDFLNRVLGEDLKKESSPIGKICSYCMFYVIGGFTPFGTSSS